MSVYIRVFVQNFYVLFILPLDVSVIGAAVPGLHTGLFEKRFVRVLHDLVVAGTFICQHVVAHDRKRPIIDKIFICN